MSSFADILNMPAADIKEPPPHAAGTYRCQIVKAPENIKSKSSDSEGIKFGVKLIQPMQDVDPAKMPENWNQSIEDLEFWVTAKSAYVLAKFLSETLGLNAQGRTLKQMLDSGETLGKTFCCMMTTDPSVDQRTKKPTGRMRSKLDAYQCSVDPNRT